MCSCPRLPALTQPSPKQVLRCNCSVAVWGLGFLLLKLGVNRGACSPSRALGARRMWLRHGSSEKQRRTSVLIVEALAGAGRLCPSRRQSPLLDCKRQVHCPRRLMQCSSRVMVSGSYFAYLFAKVAQTSSTVDVIGSCCCCCCCCC